MSSQIVLILGAGANVGKSLIQKFSSKGFKVAIASRTLKPEVAKLADSSVKADFSNPSSIKSIFEKVKSEVGTPNVVIYNGETFPLKITSHARDMMIIKTYTNNSSSLWEHLDPQQPFLGSPINL
jgi:NAD(P)-dependent dehydrogenase (short-subunit alcohol dehydrogenase family)